MGIGSYKLSSSNEMIPSNNSLFSDSCKYVFYDFFYISPCKNEGFLPGGLTPSFIIHHLQMKDSSLNAAGINRLIVRPFAQNQQLEWTK